jgi:hypothetical protein
VGAAITSPQLLGSAEAPIVTAAAFTLLSVVILAIFLPRAISISVAVFCGWGSLALLIKAFRLRFPQRK